MVITGATSGIGEAVALMYVKGGAKVVTAGRNAEKGKVLVEKIIDMGGEGIFVPCDLRKKEDVAELNEAAYKAYN